MFEISEWIASLDKFSSLYVQYMFRFPLPYITYRNIIIYSRLFMYLLLFQKM